MKEMDSLPTELLLKIFDYIDPVSWQSWCLTSKRLNSVRCMVNPNFTEITSKGDLEKLWNNIKNSKYRCLYLERIYKVVKLIGNLPEQIINELTSIGTVVSFQTDTVTVHKYRQYFTEGSFLRNLVSITKRSFLTHDPGSLVEVVEIYGKRLPDENNNGLIILENFPKDRNYICGCQNDYYILRAPFEREFLTPSVKSVVKL